MIIDNPAPIILDIKNSFSEYSFPIIAFICIRTQIPPKEHIPAINGIYLVEFDVISETFDISNIDFIIVHMFSDKPMFFNKLNTPSESSSDISTEKNRIVMHIINNALPVDKTA